MKRMAILAATLAMTAPTLAALPPQYQRAAEFRAVINVAAEVLGLIDSVRFIADDVYEARSGTCIVIVTIENLPPEKGREPIAGPRQFRAVAQQPTCE